MTTAQHQVRKAVMGALWDDYPRASLDTLRAEVAHFARRRGLSEQEREDVVEVLVRDTSLVARSG